MNGKPYGGGNSGPGGNRNHNQKPGGKPWNGGNAAGIDKITAPYNFVPLSKKVFFPDWADKVSHDVPFADGICGELECELTTHTPIYVRNGGKWEHDQVMRDPEAQSFFYVKVDGQKKFMIPGSSLKGMLRNVIEIAAFGKLTKVDDHRYGVRDLTNPNKKLYVDHMTDTVGPQTYKARAKAAWLTINPETEGWELIPCACARVEQNDLIRHHSSKPEGIKKRISALEKYRLWGNNLELTFNHDGERDYPHSCGKLRYVKARDLGNGKISGRVVFTGQPAENKRHVDPKNRSKHMEFIFFVEEAQRIEVPKNVKKDFQFIHSDANEQPNEEWGYWKKKLAHGERVPVFYLPENDGAPRSMGLALMYRLPYKNSVLEAIHNTSADHHHADPDLAETLFGFVDGNQDALKGRVGIAAAVATQASPADPVQTVLGGPKASFYPNYIEQPSNVGGGGNYQTFMDDNCRIRGWKRYPVRLKEAVQVPRGVTDKVDTKLIPLKEGARFSFRVKVHNLKPAELGALAWALTWGNSPELRHSLGMGKSLGFGVAEIKIGGASLRDMQDGPVDWQACIGTFVNLMDREVGGNWVKTAQMEQLLAMANPGIKPQCGALKHLFLAPGAGNEFVQAKKAKLSLAPHLRPAAMADDARFKNLPARAPAGQKHGCSTSAAAAQAPPVAAATPTETWPQAKLTYNRGPKMLTAQAADGKRAEVQLTGSFAQLLTEDLLNTLAKGKVVAAQVTVEKLGTKWRINAVALP